MNMQKLEFFSVHRFFCDIIVEYANVCVFIYMQRICQFFHRIFIIFSVVILFIEFYLVHRIFMIFFCCNFVHRIRRESV